MSPRRRYESAMTRSRPDSCDPELLHEHGGLVGFQLAQLHLDPGRQGLHHDVLVLVSRQRSRPRGRASSRHVPLPDVEEHEDRLLGEEPEAADGLRVVGIEAQVADRRPGLEGLMDAPHHDLFALGGLALGLGAVAAAALESLQPPLGHREVGEDELEVELLEVASGIHAARRMRMGRILERADDVQERVGVAQPREVVRRELLGPDPTLRRRRRRR